MFLYGASGHAKVIIDSLTASGDKISGLFDDNTYLSSLLEFPVFGKFSKSVLNKEQLIISIGVNSTRKKIVDLLPNDISYGIAVHPTSTISKYSRIGEGTVVMQGAIIQSSTIIGKHCIINTHASVDHDCIVQDYVHISPNSCLCGGVTVGEGSQIGAGAVILPGIKIGKWSLIAAGSVVLKDVNDNVVVIGNPARVIKNNNIE